MTEETRCPTCDSPAPHLHPAVQHEGEVQVCGDNFHKRVTNQNPALVAAPSREERLEKALREINRLATCELNGMKREYYVTNRGDIAAVSRAALGLPEERKKS